MTTFYIILVFIFFILLGILIYLIHNILDSIIDMKNSKYFYWNEDELKMEKWKDIKRKNKKEE